MLHASEYRDVVAPTYNPAWLNDEDFIIPKIKCDQTDYKLLYQKALAKLEKISDIIKNG